MAFEIGQAVRFGGSASVVRERAERSGETAYLIDNGADAMPMWIPENILAEHQEATEWSTVFNRRSAALIAVDDFFSDPDEIRTIALAQEYHTDERFYKGLRSNVRYLWPYLREEFGRILGTSVTKWMEHNANGCFQMTTSSDQLVWHSDSQGYAAAVYLTPDAPLSAGTSFWRDRTYGCRRYATHPLETQRLGSEEAVDSAAGLQNDQYNLIHPDNWELVESVAGLYNRLVIWDAKLIHSATSYQFAEEAPDTTRLVQLFFFDVEGV